MVSPKLRRKHERTDEGKRGKPYISNPLHYSELNLRLAQNIIIFKENECPYILLSNRS
jgi:hypothetical protein